MIQRRCHSGWIKWGHTGENHEARVAGCVCVGAWFETSRLMGRENTHPAGGGGIKREK